MVEEDDFSKLKDKVNDDEQMKMIDEYHDVDFEDVIAGGIKTKFRYVDVNFFLFLKNKKKG